MKICQKLSSFILSFVQLLCEHEIFKILVINQYFDENIRLKEQ
jgi:hypothetical protein